MVTGLLGVELWWSDTALVLEKAQLPSLHWVLVDANAPLDATPSEFRGPHGAESTHAVGQLFQDFIEHHHLYVPATYAALHSGETKTSTHSSGLKYRRDYVLASTNAFAMVTASWVLAAYDGTFCHEDHLPAAAHFQGSVTSTVRTSKVRSDEDKLRHPECCRKFQEALITLPVPTWSVVTTEHCLIYELNVLQLAQQFFVKDSKARDRPPIAPDTAKWIAGFKRHILDCARAFGCLADEEIKALMKDLEKEVRLGVREDLQLYYDQLLVRLQDAGGHHDFRTMFRALTRFGSRRTKTPGARPLPALRPSDGTFTTSFTEQQKLWMQQFGQIEARTEQTWSSLLQQDRPGIGPPHDVQVHEAFPSPWCLQHYLRKLKRGKTPGANQLPSAVF